MWTQHCTLDSRYFTPPIHSPIMFDRRRVCWNATLRRACQWWWRRRTSASPGTTRQWIPKYGSAPPSKPGPSRRLSTRCRQMCAKWVNETLWSETVKELKILSIPPACKVFSDVRSIFWHNRMDLLSAKVTGCKVIPHVMSILAWRVNFLYPGAGQWVDLFNLSNQSKLTKI